MDIRNKLYITTVAQNDWQTAEKYGAGIEIAEFCTAYNMDTYFEETDKIVREKMKHADRFVFHAPFNELCPAAIDPLVVEVTKKRYKQAVETSLKYGIKRMVFHSGYTPLIYYKSWFIDRSIEFWQDFLKDAPEDMTFCYENVMEDSPDMPFEIVSAVNDPRLGLCLDIGHATTMVSDVPAYKWVEKYGKLMNHLHLHSNVGKMDDHAPLGTGIIDAKQIMDLILETAPDATLTVESIDAEGTCIWLKENGYLG